MLSQFTQTFVGVLAGMLAGLSVYFGWALARADPGATLMRAVQYGIGIVIAGAVHLAPGPFPAYAFALSALAAVAVVEVFIRPGSDGTVLAKAEG